MRIATAIVVALLVGASAEAQLCGDANRTGSVTVTDGVLVLRSAAELPGICPRERCDMNLDGRTSVTDGVLALRVAAGIQSQVACSESQARSIFGQISKTLRFGNPSSAANRARIAGTTTPCSGGGFVEDDGTTLTFFECREGDFITDGTISFFSVDEQTVDVDFDTLDFVVSTGEANATFGTLRFFFGDAVQVDGELAQASNVIGEYTDTFTTVRLNDLGEPFFGTITTIITNGLGLFANVTRLDAVIYSPTLVQIGVTYTDETGDLFTLADGLCEPCGGTGCGNQSLVCLPCQEECATSVSRCSIDFAFIECGDGLFGADGLCQPCDSNAQCDQSQGLQCFPCDRNCSGSVNRCGSTIAFVECEDGTF